MIRNSAYVLAVMLTLPLAATADLTGKWRAEDGGTYYIRQIGDQIYWYGEQSVSNPGWSNAFVGQVRGNVVKGRWADVPKGRTRNHGHLVLTIRENGNVLVATSKSGGFGGSKWTRVGYVPTPVAFKQDCLALNPATTEQRLVNGRWKIVDGRHLIFDFGNKRGEATEALDTIKHYGMDQVCYVGRPGPSLTYLLVSGKAPSARKSGEDCVAFNPSTSRASYIKGRWKIVDGKHWVFDFGAKKNEATQALKIIRRYGFTRSCFVGRPRPSFTYLRR